MNIYFTGKVSTTAFFMQSDRQIGRMFYIIVNQKWIAKNPLILYIEHRGTEARRNKYIEKVKTIEPDFYSVNSVLSKNKALCLCVSVFHSIFRKPILFYYNVLLSVCCPLGSCHGRQEPRARHNKNTIDFIVCSYIPCESVQSAVRVHQKLHRKSMPACKGRPVCSNPRPMVSK